MVWVIVLAVLVAVVVAAVLLRRRSSTAAVASPPTPPGRPPRAAEAPMTGLESALAEVTDREGRSIGERIDAEADHVDDLRIPDDTGPLLRRALDHVEHRDVEHRDVEHADVEHPEPRPGAKSPEST